MNNREISQEIANIRTPQLFKPLMLQPVWKDIFAPNGELLREGELIRRTALSQTLAAIAKGGADAFYKV